MMESHKKLDSGSAGLQAGEFATISNWGLQPARDLLFPPLVRLSLRPRFYGFALQRRNRLIVHVPHLQDAKDNTTGESGARQAAKHLGRVLLRCRISDALALQILSRQLLLVDVLVRRTDRLVDDVTMDTLGLQILHHALAPKLLVFPAKAGVALGVIGVIQILLFLKFSNYYFNQQFTIKLGLDSLPHQPLQLPDGTHLASQRANGVLVQHRFVVHLLRASERHGAIISIHPIRHPERSDRRDRSQRTCCSRKVPGDLTICHHERSEGSAFLAPCNNPNVRHPVYNDAGVVKAHFSLDVLRPTLSPQQVFFSAKHSGGSLLCNSSLLWNPAVDPRWFHQPSIRQLLPGSLLRSPLRLTGRRAAHSSVRSGYRLPQDDPGLPACPTSSAYVHSLRSIQYNLTANRRATITLATARLPLRTHSRL